MKKIMSLVLVGLVSATTLATSAEVEKNTFTGAVKANEVIKKIVLNVGCYNDKDKAALDETAHSTTTCDGAFK